MIDRVTRPRTKRLPHGVKRDSRDWFTAAIRFVDLLRETAELEPRRGCVHVAIEIWPDETIEKTTKEPYRNMTANIGDRLILCGPTVEETHGCEVTRIELDGYKATLHVRMGYGGPIEAGTVRVCKAGRAA